MLRNFSSVNIKRVAFVPTLLALAQLGQALDSLGDLQAAQAFEGNLSADFEFTFERNTASAVQSITSEEPSTKYIDSSSANRILGTLNSKEGVTWTTERSDTSPFELVQGIWKGKHLQFTLDSAKRASVKPQGLIFTEGHVGFFAGDLLHRSLMGKGPTGEGYSLSEVLSAYSLRSRRNIEGGIEFVGEGPRPYIATLVTDEEQSKLLKVTVRSTEPSLVYERSMEFTKWIEWKQSVIPVEAKFVLRIGVREGGSDSGPGESIHGSVKLSNLRECTEDFPLQDGMVFYDIDKETLERTALLYARGKFQPTEDPGLQFHGDSSSPLMPIWILGAGGAVLGFVRFRRRAIKGI